LKEGERIVTSGQFMLDSESQLREAIQKMLQPNQPVGNESVAQVSHETVTSTPNVTNASPSELSLKYTCPMASHADVVSDKPGKCPKCEMDLVPTSTVSHGKVAEETWRKQHSSTPPIADTMPQQHQH